ncbi:ferrochelatase [Sporolactobacillus sp. THM19-2]|jgi:ferrochelatase|uniref:ferrochelatase n=1 Tax=Sporolactobacillus sp. THM19-2 TaxID=2511171 RepID=UPI00101E94CB|nr:ferrochelatase [Sporolactobacillus sp. THM19-2]RYL92623.1 ferrochelatase [Sporolactobacillus sp. THM19-2]
MEKTAVLLVNLGTPDAPDAPSVRKYLAEFLSDPRVIDLPRWKWLPILHGVILRVRPKKSARLYQAIWSEHGSPLLYYSRKQQAALETRFRRDGVRISLAMTYGNPSIAGELSKLHAWGVRKLIILPLFPQYSSTTTASVWDSVRRAMSPWRDVPELIFIRDYPDHPLLIDALEARIRQCFSEHGTPDTLVVSYHGIPVRYARSGDDYPSRCMKTTEALIRRFPGLDVISGYQSRFGNEPWLTPATADILKSLPRAGKTRVCVIAPGFTSDCLETLHELKMDYAGLFRASGGETFHYIPAPNDSSLFIDCLENMIRNHLPVHQPKAR